jgi:hypothetical protein
LRFGDFCRLLLISVDLEPLRGLHQHITLLYV